MCRGKKVLCVALCLITYFCSGNVAFAEVGIENSEVAVNEENKLVNECSEDEIVLNTLNQENSDKELLCDETEYDISEKTEQGLLLNDTTNTEKVIEILQQPIDCETKVGEVAGFSVVSSGENDSYRWYYSKDNGETWNTCQYGTSYKTNYFSFMTQNYMYQYLYRCLVTSETGVSIWSEYATLKKPIVQIVITSQPKNCRVSVGENAVFEISAQGESLNYRWYYSKDNGATWNTCQYGSTYKTNYFTFVTSQYQYNYQYKCLVTDANGNELFSDAVALEKVDLSIVSQPEDQYCPIGTQASFSVVSNDDKATYRWYYSKDNGETWDTCQYGGYRSNCLSFDVKSYQYDFLFKCLVKNSEGEEIFSETAILFPQHMSIVKQPFIELVDNQSYLSIEVDGYKLSYEWYASSDNGDTWNLSTYTGRKTSQMTITDNRFNELYFYCKVIDRYGNELVSDVFQPNVSSTEQNHISFFTDDSLYSLSNLGYQYLFLPEDFESEVLLENDSKLGISYSCNYNVSTSDVLLLHFTAYASEFCGKIKVALGGTSYVANLVLPIGRTDYVLPISGVTSINSVEVTLSTEKESFSIGNVEMVNCGAIDVTSIQTGIFDTSDSSVIITKDESDGVGYACTDLVTDNNYLYSVYRGTLCIYSLEIPDTPQIISSLDGLGNSREIAFANDGKALAISARENGVFFVDISDPFNPYIISNLSTIGFATGIYVEENYCFISCRYHGLEIYDISDMNNPVFCSQIYEENSELYDCTVASGTLYISSWAQRKVLIYDLTDVCMPTRISSINLEGNAGGAVVVDDVLYVATGYHSTDEKKKITSPGYGMGNGMEIYDVSEPSNPRWMSTTRIDGRYFYSAFDHWKVIVSGQYAYLVSTYNGMYCYDVSDLKAPVRVMKWHINIDSSSTFYKTIDLKGKYLFSYDINDHAQPVTTSVAIADGAIYCGCDYGDVFSAEFSKDNSAVKARGLYTIGFDDAVFCASESSELFGSNYQVLSSELSIEGYSVREKYTDTTIFDITKYNGSYFCAAGVDGIQVLDEELNVKTTFKTKGPALDIEILDDFVYVAESSAGLAIYSFENGEFTEVGRCTYQTYNISFSYFTFMNNQDFILAQLGWTRYAILDVSNRKAPKIVSTKTTGTMYVHNLSSGVVGSKFVCENDRSYLRWFTVSDNNVLQVCQLNNTIYSEPNGTAVKGEYAVSTYGNGYVYYDPATITQDEFDSLKVIKIPGVSSLQGEPIIYNDIMVVTNGTARSVTIVNVSDLENPVLISQIKVSGNPGIAYLHDEEIVIPDGHCGIISIKKEK